MYIPIKDIYITWQMVRFGSGHSGCGLEWAILNGLKMGQINWVTSRVGQVELTHIFHIKKKTNKCQIFRESESN